MPPAHQREPIFDVQKTSVMRAVILGAGDEESADASSADVQMASDNASPDVEPEADAQGRFPTASRSPCGSGTAASSAELF